MAPKRTRNADTTSTTVVDAQVEPSMPAVDAEAAEDVEFAPDTSAFDDCELGPPGAVSYNAKLLGRDSAHQCGGCGKAHYAVPGSFVTVECTCGTKFLCDLLVAELKSCPNCKTQYTHIVVFAPVDNVQAVRDFVDNVVIVNYPEGDDDDSAEDDDGDSDDA